MRRAGHVARKEGVEKISGGNTSGRNSVTVICKCEIVGWIYLPHDRHQWGVFVNTVTNSCV